MRTRFRMGLRSDYPMQTRLEKPRAMQKEMGRRPGEARHR